MSMQFKAILSNKNLYKEVLLPANAGEVVVGTVQNAEVRLPRNLFFEQFELNFLREGESWTVTCSPNLYLTNGSMSKLPQKQLQHGDELQIKYDSSDAVLMSMSVMIDFDEVDQDFYRFIDISGRQKIRIGGGRDCDIQIHDPDCAQDEIWLMLQNEHYLLQEKQTQFGVYVNGVRIKQTAALRDYDFFSLDQYKFFLKGSCLYTTQKESVRVNGLPQYRDVPSQSRLEYPKFNRNTRLKAKPCEEEIAVLDPPEKPNKPQDNLAMTLMPSLAMLIVTVVLRSVMNAGGGSYIILSACMMGVGILTSIATFIMNRRKYKTEIRQREEKYGAYIAKKREMIQQAREEERKTLEEIYYSEQRDLKHVVEFSGRLFDRTADDDDFAQVYLGKGSCRSLRPIRCKEQEAIEVTDEMTLVPEQLCQEYREIEGAPITLPLARYDAVGVIGSYPGCVQLLKNMTLDLAARHYHSDLQLYFIASEEHAGDIQWARWLPHVENESLGMRNIVCDAQSRGLIFESLFVQLSALAAGLGGAARRSIIFVLDDMGIRNHPLSQYIKGCAEKGFTFIFFDRCEEYLPQNCGAVIRLKNEPGKAELVDTQDCEAVQSFEYEPLSSGILENVCLKLAPVFCEEVSLESSLTKSYTFFQMMNIYTVEDIDLAANWQNARITSTMAAPLGINAKNQQVMLDLHEKAHGPHGLVAGTTGSGKSEILQSYILSMAIHYHPYEVGFVIIDFKGGGMANQLKGLPHLMGAITNIDGREIDRSLKSIKAELQKRQRLFAQSGVNKIDDYIQKFKKGEEKIALPHLIIIVDEFAELKADQPEFMKELISAARIGRSLGVHLILATQKPSGQVNEQIWSNSKFKLCLKVQNQEDSKEVLRSPLAAEIREPGRAYLQVGNNEIFELFQSAYSGGAAKADELGNDREFELEELNLWGQRRTVYRRAKKKAAHDDSTYTQLDAVVEYVHDYCESKHIAQLPEICLPPLPMTLAYRPNTRQKDSWMIDIGIYDSPDTQYQGPVALELATQNTVIIGSAQNGKTTLLQTIIRGLEDTYTPDEVNIYILDFGSMVLKNFESSHHVGGVVCAPDDEKLKNLFRLLDAAMEERKNKLAAVGVSSFASYREAGYTDLPQIVVIVDNYTALKELYFADEDPLLGVCRDGLTLGISVVLANSQTNGIGFRYMANFAQKIALSCNDSGEYAALLDRCRMTPANFPGRGLIAIDKEIYEFQTYLPFEGEKEIERVEAIRTHTAALNCRYPQSRARAIPQVPEVLDDAYVKENLPKHLAKPYAVPVGIDYETVAWSMLDLCKISSLAITGRERFGKTNYLALVLNYLQENVFDYPSKVYIMDDYDRQLARFSSYGIVEKYTVECTELDYILSELEQQLKARQEKVRSGQSVEEQPLLVCVFQNSDLMAQDGIKRAQADAIRSLIKNSARLKVCIIFSGVENTAVSYSGPEGMKLAKECKNIMVFDDLCNLKLVDVPMATQRRFKKSLELGDAYLVTENETFRQKIVHAQ